MTETEAAPEIAGRVTIEWPNAERCAPGPLRGTTAIRDAATGEPLRALTVTVTDLPGGPIVADVTHPANGDRALAGKADGYWDTDARATAVRRYEVTRMTETPPVEPWTAQVNRALLRDFLRRAHQDGGTVEALTLTANDMRELVYGPDPHSFRLSDLGDLIREFTEEGVTLPERIASTRVTRVRSPAPGAADIPARMAPEGEESSALVRHGPDGSRAVTVAVAASEAGA